MWLHPKRNRRLPVQASGSKTSATQSNAFPAANFDTGTVAAEEEAILHADDRNSGHQRRHFQDG
jgi:hypothetical protein